MRAILINGGPRKGWNTEKALAKAAEGAAAAGAEVETIRLYDYEYRGCISCFACKIKNSRTNGLCAVRDALRPVLEKCHEADVVIVGTPVYYNYPTGMTRAFLERWLFPVGSYYHEDGKQKVYRDKVIPTGMIYTMNCPRDLMENWNYPAILSDTANIMGQIMGHNELLYICNTYQFADYDRYEFNLFDEAEKRAYRDAHFEEDLQAAYELGRRLVERAKEEV